MTDTWIPLDLLNDVINSLEYQLSHLAKKDDTTLEKTEILIQDDYRCDGIDVLIRAFSKDKNDYAYAKKVISKNIIAQIRYTPKLSETNLKRPKTPEEMIDEIMGLLE
jgi:hypothetical protein